MADLSKEAHAVIVNEDTRTILLRETHSKQFGSNQKFHPIKMQNAFITSMALMLMGCGGEGSASGDNTNSSHADTSNTTNSNTTHSNTTNSTVDTVMDKEPLNDNAAARFLQQAQFSSTKQEIDYLNRSYWI